jgi:transcription antitermination factor NusG
MALLQLNEPKWVRSHAPSEVTGRSYARVRDQNSDMLEEGANLQCVGGEALPRWYAVWTRSRHEKSVSDHLSRKDLETFLPLYSTIRRWKNGDHRVEMPLFPGYTFVRMRLEDHLQVLKVAGVVRLVGFGSMPTPLEDGQVESLRRALGAGVKAEPHPYLTAGRRVRITAGPLAGREGLLVRWKSALRVVLSVDLIQRSILVDTEAQALEPVADLL